MNKELYVIVAAVLVALTGLSLWYWVERPTPILNSMPTPTAPPSSPEVPPQAASEPAIRYPVESLAASNPENSPLKLETALIDLFGRKTVLTLFQLDDFTRLAVVTIDNLGRPAAPARQWPLNPAGGRFTVIKQGDVETISSDNDLRYTPYVLLLERVDLGQAVAMYRRFYAQFQQAYEYLGFPKRHFTDRLVEVVDLLIATPETGGAIKVHLPIIDGPIRPERPWVLYEFNDPAGTMTSLAYVLFVLFLIIAIISFIIGRRPSAGVWKDRGNRKQIQIRARRNYHADKRHIGSSMNSWDVCAMRFAIMRRPSG